MARRRQTIKVQWLKERVNHVLANSKESTPEKRAGMISVLELVLWEANDYRGFIFLESAGKQDPTTHRLMDETRRRYL